MWTPGEYLAANPGADVEVSEELLGREFPLERAISRTAVALLHGVYFAAQQALESAAALGHAGPVEFLVPVLPDEGLARVAGAYRAAALCRAVQIARDEFERREFQRMGGCLRWTLHMAADGRCRLRAVRRAW